MIAVTFTAPLVAGLAIGQTDHTAAQSANPRDYTLVATFPVAEPANAYLHFFSGVKDLGVKPLSPEARSLRLNNQEVRALLTVTKALAKKSREILAIAKPIIFEVRIHLAGTGKIPSELETERAALQGRWGAMVLDSVRELQEVLPEPCSTGSINSCDQGRRCLKTL